MFNKLILSGRRKKMRLSHLYVLRTVLIKLSGSTLWMLHLLPERGEPRSNFGVWSFAPSVESFSFIDLHEQLAIEWHGDTITRTDRSSTQTYDFLRERPLQRGRMGQRAAVQYAAGQPKE